MGRATERDDGGCQEVRWVGRRGGGGLLKMP